MVILDNVQQTRCVTLAASTLEKRKLLYLNSGSDWSGKLMHFCMIG